MPFDNFISVNQGRIFPMFSFKKISAAALAAIAFFTVSAAEAKPADCAPRDVRVACYFKDTPSQGQVAQSSQSATSPEVFGFREPNATPEQVLLATSFSQAAFRQCMGEVRRDENRRGWNEAGQQVGAALADRLIRGNRYGYYNNYRSNYNNGANQSLRSCEEVRDRTYADMLHTTPAAYCDRVMTTTRRRDGTPINGGVVNERCQSRSSEPFDANMRYTGNGN